MSNFHPLEVVVRGSETQFQVGGNLNFSIQRLKGYYVHALLSETAPHPVKYVINQRVFFGILTFLKIGDRLGDYKLKFLLVLVEAGVMHWL